MKKTFRIFQCGASKMHFGTLFVICFLAAGPLSSGAPLRSAHVSQVIRDVRLLPTNATPRPAAVNDNIVEGTAVRTGIESRAELTFADLTITRLGENTVFSFREAARELNISKGAVLVEVPSKAPAARINTAAVTAAVMGGTGLFATGPPVKFMVLEGIGTFYPAGHPEQAVTVQGGEMVMLTADGHITQPTKFNVQLVLQTSHLIVDFPNLANLPLILQVVNQQLADQSAGTSNPPPSKNPLLGVIDVVTQNVTANPAVESFTATPTPPPSGTPSKFGPPSTITSPNPYVITSGTTITTDPTITTNGVTDFGKVWRGPSIDGPLSAFIFGSTSAFDTSSGFDTQLNGQMGGAGFKFTALQLTGNPTIVTTNGEINLGLIAVDSITSGSPGGVLTFAGIRGLLLATQNGPITLGPEISFSGLHDLNIYARGSGGDLTLGSNISTTSKVRLFVERDLSVTSNITTETFRAVAGGKIMISDPAVIHSRTISLSAGQDISLTTGGNLSADSIDALIISGAGTISGGAMINLTTGSISAGTGFLQSLIGNTNGTIGGGASLSLQANGTITTGDFLEAFVFNDGGHIGGAADVIVHVTGDINVGTSAFFGIGNVGGTIGSGSTVDVRANNISTGGFLEGYIDNTNGSIGGEGGGVSVHADGTITTGAALDVFGTVSAGGNINAQTLSSTNVTTPGSIVAGNGGILQFKFPSGLVPAVLHTLTATSVTSQGGINFNGIDGTASSGPADGGQLTINANSLDIGKDVIGFVTFDGGGGVNSNSTGANGGIFSVNTTGNVSVALPISATTGQNAPNTGFGGAGGTVNLKSSAGSVEVSNSTIQVSSADPMSTTSPYRSSASGGDITITSGKAGSPLVNGRAIAVGVNSGSQLLALLDSAAPGPGGTITILATGANSEQNIEGTIQADRGTIDIRHTGDNAAVNLNAGNDSQTNAIQIRADIVKVGAFGANGQLNIGGGAISANTLLKLYAPTSNGILNFVANVALSAGTAADLAANTITIQPSVVVTIAGNGGPANIFTNNPNYNFTPGPGYTGPRGNPSNGSFGGNGARDPQPLASAPSFNASTLSRAGRRVQTSSITNVTSSSKSGLGGGGSQRSGEAAASHLKTTSATMNIGDSGQLLSLLDAAVPGPSGRITIPASNRTIRSKNSDRSNVDGPSKANSGTAGARHVRDSADNPRLLASSRSVAP